MGFGCRECRLALERTQIKDFILYSKYNKLIVTILSSIFIKHSFKKMFLKLFQEVHMVELKGRVERITSHNEETSYTVAKMKFYGYDDLITVLGNFLSINPGEELKLHGNWRTHPKYGKQFKVDSYESITC